jgi:hypothetical protein
MTDDYKRNGTATMFAALNVADGIVISMCDDRHRHQEWPEELIMAIRNYINRHNQKPKPFIWTARASDILEKVNSPAGP